MVEEAEPAAKLLNSVNEIKNLINTNQVVIIGFFDTVKDKFFDSFIDSTEQARNNYIFGYTTDPTVIQHYKTKSNTVILYQPEIFWSKYEKRYHIFNRVFFIFVFLALCYFFNV